MGELFLILLFFYEVIVSLLFGYICIKQKKELDTKESLIDDLSNELAKIRRK